MPEFKYTHSSTDLDSSAVDEVYYNENTKELAVDLHDSVYVYPNVSKETYEALVDASSIGRAYREVKRTHGPSNYLGEFGDIYYRQERVHVPAADMSAVGTPKGLTYASGAVVTNVTSTFPLTAPTADANRRFEVTFEVVGKTRQHRLNAENFGEAEAEVLQIGNMLDLAFTVTEIRVL